MGVVTQLHGLIFFVVLVFGIVFVAVEIVFEFLIVIFIFIDVVSDHTVA